MGGIAGEQDAALEIGSGKTRLIGVNGAVKSGQAAE